MKMRENQDSTSVAPSDGSFSFTKDGKKRTPGSIHTFRYRGSTENKKKRRVLKNEISLCLTAQARRLVLSTKVATGCLEVTIEQRCCNITYFTYNVKY